MKKLLLIALLSLVLFTFGCPEETPETKTGKLSLSITDKQVEGIEELHVTITAIEVHKAGAAGDENSDGNNNGENSSWILFSEEEKTFDIMQLDSSEGLKAVLGEKELEVGKYTQIRLTVKEVKAKINGEEFDVEVPSNKLKLVHGFEIKEGEETELIIDFSPESVIKANDTYKLKPVIKVLTPKQFQERKDKEEKDECNKRCKEEGYLKGACTGSGSAVDAPSCDKEGGTVLYDEENPIEGCDFLAVGVWQECCCFEEQKMTLERAREIAENSECMEEGTLKETYTYNEDTKTWWIDLEATEPQEGCNPACVVNEETETAEINWRCTGLEGQDTGLFTLLLSDAEADIADFESVNVSFDHARIFLVDSNTGFKEIDLNGASVDLTTVVGELAVPLVQIELDTGTYSKIELYVLDVNAILLDGNTAEVFVPSGKLKIMKPFTIDTNTETKFVFDIQIVKKGQGNEYNLLPVVAKSGVVGKDLDEEEVEEIEPEEEIEVDDSEFLEEVCDANTSCPIGYECADFPAEVGLKCYLITGTESVCDFVTCPTGYECVIAESYPVQISCSEITE